MILSAKKLCSEIRLGLRGDESGIVVVPTPDLAKVDASGEASVSLRLGRWFVTLRQSSETHLTATHKSNGKENKFSKKYFVPFGESFVLHPNRFALASTLEWVRLP